MRKPKAWYPKPGVKMRFNQHPLLINTLLGEQNNPLFFFVLFSLVDMVSLKEIRFNLHPLLINIK